MALELTLRPGEVLLLDGATLKLASDHTCRLTVDGIARPNCPLAVIDVWEATTPKRPTAGATPTRTIQ